jgi:hypothetical protein
VSPRRALLAIALLCAGCDRAASPEPPGPVLTATSALEAAAARADVAFYGTVVEVRVERDAGSGLPFTYVTARVEEPLRGEAAAGALVTWRLVGGTLDGRTVSVPDAPTFAEGESAYWLLASPRTGATPWPVLAGLAAGKWARRGEGAVVSGAGERAGEPALRAALLGGRP